MRDEPPLGKRFWIGFSLYLLFAIVFISYYGLREGTTFRVIFLAFLLLVVPASIIQFIQDERKEKRARDARRIEYEIQSKLKAELRDADQQTAPYTYRIDRHANETLAIRYGIANLTEEVTPYYYYTKGGTKTRDSDRDRKRTIDAKTIKLRKLRKVRKDVYEVEITEWRNRRAFAVIEPGTEYVKTFLPFENDWFERHDKLEQVLKGNKSFSLKELARIHIDKAT